jgi:hypothetical protein
MGRMGFCASATDKLESVRLTLAAAAFVAAGSTAFALPELRRGAEVEPAISAPTQPIPGSHPPMPPWQPSASAARAEVTSTASVRTVAPRQPMAKSPAAFQSRASGGRAAESGSVKVSRQKTRKLPPRESFARRWPCGDAGTSTTAPGVRFCDWLATGKGGEGFEGAPLPMPSPQKVVKG